jgi:hypothetical protein
VNGAPVNADGIQLRHQDVLDLAGTQMLFVLN